MHLQKTLQSALSDLTLSSSLVARLGILSPNETVEDMHTSSLRCILLPSLRADLELVAKTTSGTERIAWLSRARVRPPRLRTRLQYSTTDSCDRHTL